jgi:hypothetical protein
MGKEKSGCTRMEGGVGAWGLGYPTPQMEGISFTTGKTMKNLRPSAGPLSLQDSPVAHV